jgi:hypothetical protein
MSQLHAALGIAVIGASVLFALAAFAANAMDRSPRWLDGVRLVIAGLAVTGASTGLALALTGTGPSEWIHWLYGVLIVAVPVMAGSMTLGGSSRVRSIGLGAAGVIMALIAWRLAASG